MNSLWVAVPVMAAMFGLAAHVAQAAECSTVCRGIWGYSSDNSISYASCVSNCEMAKKSEPSVSFGAIAYGARSTAAGWAYGKASASAANSTALFECRKHGDDCQLVITLSNGCAAVAAIESQGIFAVGQGSTRQQAKSRAMNACTGQHGSECKVEAWTCP